MISNKTDLQDVPKVKSFFKRTTVKHALKIGPQAFVEKYLFPAMRREHGAGFAMDTWRDVFPVEWKSGVYCDGITRALPSCRTVSCVGGTMQMILQSKENTRETVLGQVLGLTKDGADALFYGYHRYHGNRWPASLQLVFKQAVSPAEKERVAEVMILRAIETKGECFDYES